MPPRSGGRPVRLTLALCCLCLLLPRPTLAQEIRYLYDALNRLVAVVDPQGNAAEYVYDAVGNLLEIKRVTVPPGAALAITLVRPSKGAEGSTVQLFGWGFSATLSANQVAFNGTAAPVTAASRTSLTTAVPAGATTGPLTVTVGSTTAPAPEPFTVLQHLQVVPAQADVSLGGSFAFQATFDGAATTDVLWRVNAIPGGNATVGTVTAGGIYTAPAALPAGGAVQVEAVLLTDASQVAAATVRLYAPAGLLTAAPVTVTGATPPTAEPWSGPLTVTGGPVILGATPATGPANSSLTVTLTGSNLQGASMLRTLLNGRPDTTLTASALSAASDGTSLTFTLTIGGAAPTGPRVFQVVTPQGTSTNLDVGTNGFTVQP